MLIEPLKFIMLKHFSFIVTNLKTYKLSAPRHKTRLVKLATDLIIVKIWQRHVIQSAINYSTLTYVHVVERYRR